MSCHLCGRGIFGHCDCHSNIEPNPPVAENLATGKEDEKRKPGRPPKNDDDIGKSAGRKRAGKAIEEKLRNNITCEWAGLANVGGGKHPIVGCINNPAKHVHHGPDKNTSNNDPGNLHNICTACHNRWHAANDNDHDGTIPHSPRKATKLELIKAMSGEYEMDEDES